MDSSSIEIPAEILEAAKLSPEDIKAELAIQLYRQGRLTIAQAHFLAGESLVFKEWLEKKGWSGHIEMDQFISDAAHDLKSPMNAITGFTKVVLKGIDGPVNETQISDLNTAFKAGQRMLGLLNNLIDMARLNIGEITIEKNVGDLAEVIADACTRWKNQNPTKELQSDIQINTSGMVLDSVRMRQTIVGLLTYAGNHVADTGKLVLRAQDNEKMFTIRISSIGEKARDKFEMDLAMLAFICRGLIERHGGQLDLGEDTGAGVTLDVSLPKP
jgi:K+-sensing histidine kinase KdpD/predicted HTH domain antitoxin